jgi:hypothetical protein
MIAACSGDRFVAFIAASAGSAGSAGASSDGAGGSTAGDGDGRLSAGTTSAAVPAAGAGRGGASGEPGSGSAGAFGGAELGGEGGASAAPECLSAASPSWELGYFPELREPATQESHPFFKITNHGESTTLDRIAMRYYFTKDSNVVETAVCYWVTGDHCSLAKMEFGDVAMPTARASRYLEVTFPEASDVRVATAGLEVRVGFKTGAEAMIQTNDYSFDPSPNAPSSAVPLPYKRWLKTTLYVDGELVWGAEPCSTTASAL